MASAATANPAVAGSLVDPHRTSKIQVSLGGSLKERAPAESRFWGVKYNHKPRRPASVTRTATLTPGLHTKLSIIDESSADNRQEHTFAGVQHPSSDIYALVVDRAARTAVLEPLGGTYALNATGADASELKARYGDATLADGDGGDGSDQAAHAKAPADPNNPFDYRHFIHGIPTARGHSTTASPAASPAHHGIGLGISAGGSSPMAAPSSRVETATDMAKSASQQSNAAASSAARTASPAPSTAAARSTVPKITRKRKAADIFAKAPTTQRPAKKPATDTTKPAASASTSAPKASKGPAASPPRQHSSPAHDDDILIIEGADDTPRNGAFASGAHATPPGLRPRSLREIATSRDASPAPGRSAGGPWWNAVSHTHPTGAAATSAAAATNGAAGRSGGARPRAESGMASARSDADVSTDLDIGSPRYEREQSEQSQHDEPMHETIEIDDDENDDDDNNQDEHEDENEDEDDGNADDLERAFKEAMGDGDEDANESDAGGAGSAAKAPPVVVNVDDDEEEVSEEE